MASQKYSGIAASNGIAIGKVYIISDKDLTCDTCAVSDIESEKRRLEDAIEEYKTKTASRAEVLRQKVGPKEAEILEGHILLISDPSMSEKMLQEIGRGVNAEVAVAKICGTFIDMFSSMEDDLMSQRALDIKDIRNGLLSLLIGIGETDLSSLPEGTILVARDLSPSMTTDIDKKLIAGIITEVGSASSHLAIISRAMEIPAVCSVDAITDIVANGDTVIVDGNVGVIYVNPEEQELTEYQQKLQKEVDAKALLSEFKGRATLTTDGVASFVFCNIGTPNDITSVIDNDGEGIGLLRTEFLFMDKEVEPSEEEQFEAYKEVVEALDGKPVIIRTLDVGGDKEIPYLDIKKEANPFLGLRAIRYCLGNRDRYKKQLRAILRASAFGKLKLMLPMITCAEEIRAVKEMVSEIEKELDAAGISYDKNIQIGCMIETPSAALIADILAKESDFFSIGTNDLTQYTMAADRGNAEVAYLNSYFQPSVLRSIRRITECGQKAGIPVGMCGEAAADPLMIPILISFGLDEFSVSPALVLRTRSVINKWSKKEADDLTEKVMALNTQEEIVSILKEKSNIR